MATLEKAIQALEKLIVTGTDYIIQEVSQNQPEMVKELTKEQRDLLLYVQVKGQTSPGDISKFQGVQKSTVSNRLSKLVKDGYMEYTISSNQDGRYRLVQLTEKGNAFIARTNDIIRNVIEGLVDNIGEKHEQETFVKMLDLIQQKIDAKGGK